jgi:hypothetical protein
MAPACGAAGRRRPPEAAARRPALRVYRKLSRPARQGSAVTERGRQGNGPPWHRWRPTPSRRAMLAQSPLLALSASDVIRLAAARLRDQLSEDDLRTELIAHVARTRPWAKLPKHQRPALLPEGLRFYDLRHTCASLIVAQGASVKRSRPSSAMRPRVSRSIPTGTCSRPRWRRWPTGSN